MTNPNPKPKKSAKTPAPVVTASDVDFRSREGRDKFDESVMSQVASATAPVASGDLLNVLGGSPSQIRKALGRLIEAGRVTSTGVTRAMRYSAAGRSRAA